jgi:hypothetical protein
MAFGPTILFGFGAAFCLAGGFMLATWQPRASKEWWWEFARFGLGIGYITTFSVGAILSLTILDCLGRGPGNPEETACGNLLLAGCIICPLLAGYLALVSYVFGDREEG